MDSPRKDRLESPEIRELEAELQRQAEAAASTAAEFSGEAKQFREKARGSKGFPLQNVKRAIDKKRRTDG